MNKDGPTEVFALMCDLFIARDMAPANKFPNCAETQIDACWHVAFNGHKEARKSADGFELQPFNGCLKFNGWPAGVFSPFGGVVAAGEAANEGTLIKALKTAIRHAAAVQP